MNTIYSILELCSATLSYNAQDTDFSSKPLFIWKLKQKFTTSPKERDNGPSPEAVHFLLYASRSSLTYFPCLHSGSST
jgi:hypothetical protein